MSPLETRKQLLIAESELNRAQFLQEWETAANGFRSIVDPARRIMSLASAGFSLVAGLASSRKARASDSNRKPSWWKTILRAALLADALWSEFKSPPKS